MGRDLVYYWRSFLEKDTGFDLTTNSFMVTFTIVDQADNVIYHRWLPFQSTAAMLGYITYIALPSGYCSRLEGKIIVDVMSCDQLTELLENPKEEKAIELAKDLHEDYALLEVVGKDMFDINELREFCSSFNSHLGHHKDTVFATLEVFKDVKEAGLSVIKGYEDVGLGILEDRLELRIEEIIRMFSTTDQNKFMRKTVGEFLESKILL